MSATSAPAKIPPPGSIDGQSFLLTRVQPALSGLMDGSLSTLAPIFAVVLATHRPLTAFFTGVATALGAGVSMAFSEGLSDTGDLTGRGSPVLRGATLTPGNESARPILDQMTADTPAGVAVQPEDIAGGVVYLVSDAAAMIHGTTLYIDGGISATRLN
jgi:hypothetical protein